MSNLLNGYPTIAMRQMPSHEKMICKNTVDSNFVEWESFTDEQKTTFESMQLGYALKRRNHYIKTTSFHDDTCAILADRDCIREAKRLA